MRIQRDTAVVLSLVAALSACGKNEAPPAEAPKATTSALASIVGARQLPFADNGIEPIVLNAGDSIGGTFNAPGSGRLGGVSVYLGTFYNTSSGKLRLELCKGERCVSGVTDLQGAQDNSDLAINVGPPLDVLSGDTVRYRLVKDGGEVKVAVWSYPAAANGPRGVTLSDGRNLDDRTLRLTLNYSK